MSTLDKIKKEAEDSLKETKHYSVFIYGLIDSFFTLLQELYNNQGNEFAYFIDKVIKDNKIDGREKS
jgi:hypothetical protein